MKKYLILFTLPLLFVLNTGFHKFYVSITQLEYIPEKQEVQIITRLFYDDLQKALQQRYDSSIKVDQSYDQQKLNRYIEKYIKQKLKIKLNNQLVKLHYLGHKDENDYVVCFIEISDVEELNALEVENTLLMDAFPQQKNVVHTQIGDSHKSFMLSEGREKAVLNVSN